MHCLPAIHVVARSEKALRNAIRASLHSLARIRCWGTTPHRRSIGATDLILLDLCDLPADVHPAAVGSLLESANLWLVAGGMPIEPEWLEIAQRPGVTVQICAVEERAHDFRPVITRLLAYLRGPSGMELAEMIVSAEPWLRPLQLLVRAACLNPWIVRRPRDLAMSSGHSMSQVKREVWRRWIRTSGALHRHVASGRIRTVDHGITAPLGRGDATGRH